jgi:hypothetical protein
MKDASTFDKPLNTWVEEDVKMPVFTPEVNEKEGRVEFKQEMKNVKQRTFYADSPQKRLICSRHEYVPLDKPKYLFGCTHCDWHRVAPPVTFKYDPEKKTLSYRENGVLV